MSTEIMLLLSFIMSFFVSAAICKLLSNPRKKRAPDYNGYDAKIDKFFCPQCGREITMAATFFEVCPFCRDSY